MRYRHVEPGPSKFSLAEQFGIRSRAQAQRDVFTILKRLGRREHPTLGLSTAGFFRPDLSLPAYAGFAPSNGVAPIYNFFDRTNGGRGYAGVVTRERMRDHRGGRLSYDEHDGTDFVCPPGTPLACAAPGVVVAVRDRFLRGALTACVDHGGGVVTQYTHLVRMIASVGQSLERGETVALSGSGGLDMLSGFPWVPPHVHFMVWVRGQPVDPYLAAGELPRAGTWAHGNEPITSRPLEGDRVPMSAADIEVDEAALDAALSRCLDSVIRAEIEQAPMAAGRLALFEDSLHHDRDAWPRDLSPGTGRPAMEASSVRLTLPLPMSLYRSARAADAPWTRP